MALHVKPTCIHECGSEVRIWAPQEMSVFLVNQELQNIYTWETLTHGAGAPRYSPWQLLPVTNIFMNFTAVIRLL